MIAARIGAALLALGPMARAAHAQSVDASKPSPAIGGPAGPTAANPVMTDAGLARMSMVLGASAYNDRDERIGVVQDVLVNRNSLATEAILSVGGFLGIGTRLVAVPYGRLQFRTRLDDATARVMMPGATKASLAALPAFAYGKGG